MDKKFLMDILKAAIDSLYLSEDVKSRAKSEYFKLEKENQDYTLLKEKSLLFINEYNSLIKDDKAQIILDDNNFLVTIIFTNYDLDSNNTKEKLTEKYFKNHTRNIIFKYNPNIYYSSIY